MPISNKQIINKIRHFLDSKLLIEGKLYELE